MKFTILPHTDIEVSRVCFGCWAIVGDSNWGPQDKSDSIAALRAAFDSGINFFDTAPAYGNGASEELIHEDLGAQRDSIVIADKVSLDNLSGDALVQSCENSLRILNTGFIDLLQVHWPNWSIPISESFNALEILKKAGKIREYAVSNFGPKDLEETFKSGYQPVTNQLCYNLIFRALEIEILPACRKADMGVLTYSSLMQGLLSGKFTSPDGVPPDRARTTHYNGDRSGCRHGEKGHEEATFDTLKAIEEIAEDTGYPVDLLCLGWLLVQPGITSIIVGGRNTEQARHNATVTDLEIAPHVISRLSAATEGLKEAMGANADPWEGADQSRIR